MARFHRATLTPSKPELIAAWARTQPWRPPEDADIEVVGAFRFDDPDGRVGIETHLVDADGTLLQVPLTYRDEPLAGADDALAGQIEHSALGTRWVYDGLADDVYLTMLAAVAMTGQGEAVGMVSVGDRWLVVPSNVRLEGGGWGTEPVPVDGFRIHDDHGASTVLRNDRFQLTFHREPRPTPRPPMGLAARWQGRPDGVVLAEVAAI